MAHIPVEKKEKSTLAWLLPLILLALLAIGGVWIAAEMLEEPEDVVVSSYIETPVITPAEEVPTVVKSTPSLLVTETQETVMMKPTGTVVSANVLAKQPATALIGRPVDVEKMKVTRVVGDNSFYVRPIASNVDRTFLVFLDEEKTPSTATEGRYDVNKGDTVTVMGHIKKMDEAMLLKKDHLLNQSEIEQASNDDIYLHADRLKMAD